MKRDWDNLIILDACRYDLFEQINTINGDLHAVISKGSGTPEFLLKNFSDSRYFDTVYISATPMIEEQRVDQNFYDVIKVWKSDWNCNLGTVTPDVMAQRVLETETKYPNKRIIAHFLQPHYPFIGPTGRNISHQTIEGLAKDDQLSEKAEYVWEQLRFGKLDINTVWRAYKENLELALPHLEKLVESLSGKTVVSSDHGNAIGEWGIYGHPTYRSLFLKALVKVPWLEIPRGERKTIIMEDRPVNLGAPDEDIKAKLAALGYR